jgi:hypothetical protein
MKDVHVKLNPVSHGKTAFNEKENIFTRKLLLNVREKLVKCYIWIIAFRKVNQKYVENFEM